MDVVELVRADEAANGKIACVLCDESQFFTPGRPTSCSWSRSIWAFRSSVTACVPELCRCVGSPARRGCWSLPIRSRNWKTICACGRKAICNGRKVNGEYVFEGAQVAIDTVDDVEYQSLCPQCWYREYRAFLARHPKK